VQGYKPDNTTRAGQEGTTSGNSSRCDQSQVRSYLTLVPSSTRMPQQTHCGWPKHYPIVHPWSEVRYHPTRWRMKLLSLGIPYVPYAPVHNQVLVHSDPTDMGLNRHRWGLQPWSSEFQIRPLILLPIHYSRLSRNCPARSPVKPLYQLFKFLTFQSRTRV
jgi:hypothetical protein